MASVIPVKFTVCVVDECEVDAMVPSTVLLPPSTILIARPA